jgi:hypothetical protein
VRPIGRPPRGLALGVAVLLVPVTGYMSDRALAPGPGTAITRQVPGCLVLGGTVMSARSRSEILFGPVRRAATGSGVCGRNAPGRTARRAASPAARTQEAAAACARAA